MSRPDATFRTSACRPVIAFVTSRAVCSSVTPPVSRTYLGYPLTGIGVARWKQGHSAQALLPLERALRIRETHEPDAATVAQTRFALARALWDDGQERPRARLLADAARDAYAREPTEADNAREVTRWLAGHRAQ